MLHLLKRHPFAVKAVLARTLVLTYALSRNVLQPLLPPGLTVDARGDLGFLAIALVQTQDMRPAFLPEAFGQDFFLAGYRIFARHATAAGKTLRGLRILQSYADKFRMVFFGNLLTHYNYRLAKIQTRQSGTHWRISLNAWNNSDWPALDVIADLSRETIPEGSPFNSFREARRYAGPLPYTFDYESKTHSIVRIEGVRKEWSPRLVDVEVLKNTLWEKPPFNSCNAVLASAFYLERIPYLWKRGVVENLKRGVR